MNYLAEIMATGEKMDIVYKEYHGKFAIKDDKSGYFGYLLGGPLFDSSKHVVTFQSYNLNLDEFNKEFERSVDEFIEWETSNEV